MQSATLSGWERALKPVRWVASIVGGGAYIIWVGFVITYNLGGGSESLTVDALQYVIWGLLGVGLVLAILWKGIGEVVGGLALVAGAVGMAFNGGGGIMALEAAALFALPGLLFIACGWYTLAQGWPHTAHTTA